MPEARVYLCWKRTTMPDTGCCETGDCPAAVAIHVLASELKLATMHSLMAHGRRFNELRELTGICQSSLARTVRELEELGLLQRLVHADERPIGVEYRLTPMGAGMSLAIEAFERWTEQWMPILRVRMAQIVREG
ncbi:MAG TPA: helix-turn-helix domain-containing protein [Thermoplasmata archaeon]|nr:helix-turn-helix domain-containing protein [Thermoplasmata archaeon]